MHEPVLVNVNGFHYIVHGDATFIPERDIPRWRQLLDIYGDDPDRWFPTHEWDNPADVQVIERYSDIYR